MEFREYYKQLLTKAFGKPFIWFNIPCALITIIIGIIHSISPNLEFVMTYLYWIIPLSILVVYIIIGIIYAPYAIHKENKDKYKKEIENIKKKRINELYTLDIDANKGKVHRIFYRIYTEGELVENTNTERRQQWDGEVLKEMANNCNQQCIFNYFLSTGRRYDKITPLQDNRFGDALKYIKQMLDYDLGLAIK